MSYIKEQGLVFGIDNGRSRSFVRFDSFEDFELWYLELDPNKRTLSEVITSDARKLILDIDSPDNLMLDKLLMYDFERHVTSRIHDVFFLLDIGRPNVIFYSMCLDNKISYHVVVSNFVFPAHTCLGLCAIISSGQIWDSCVDRSVYKTVQFMRVENSTKFGEYRWKTRLTELGSIRDGLLSDPAGTRVSGFTTSIFTPSAGLGAKVGGQRKLDSWNYIDASGDIKRQFKMGKQNKNFIVPLYRTKSGFCAQCNRIHDRENAFIKYCAGNPTFMCWRYYHTRS